MPTFRVAVTTSLLATVLLGGGHAGAVPCPASCLANASFEGVGCPPPGWTEYVEGPWPRGAACATTEVARDLLSSLRVYDPDGIAYTGVLSNPPIPVRPGERVVGGIAHRGTGGPSGLYLYFRDGAGRHLSSVGTSASVGASWQQQSVEAFVPSNASTVQLMIYSCFACSGVYYVDGATLTIT